MRLGGVRPIATSAAGAIRGAGGASSHPTSAFVMSGLSAPGHGGMRRTGITCEPGVVPSTTGHWIRCLDSTKSGYGKRQNDRMLPVMALSGIRTLGTIVPFVPTSLMTLYPRKMNPSVIWVSFVLSSESVKPIVSRRFFTSSLMARASALVPLHKATKSSA